MAKRTRVAAPGARRLKLEGIMAVSDDYGRARVIFPRLTPDGASTNKTWLDLRAAVPAGESSVPYEENDRTDPVAGVAWVVLPAHRRMHWQGVAAALRGQWVRAEVTLRPYLRRPEGAAPVRGTSLDLSMLEGLPAPGPRLGFKPRGGTP